MTAATLCSGQRRDGSPCTLAARAGRSWCFAHDPDLNGKREAARRKGGQNRATAARLFRNLPAELARLIEQYQDWIAAVEAGQMPARTGEVLGNLAARVLDVYRFAFETNKAAELEARLLELETHVKERSA